MTLIEERSGVQGREARDEAAPVTLAWKWVDIPFRVTVYTLAQWESMPASERPENAHLDDTGCAMMCVAWQTK